MKLRKPFEIALVLALLLAPAAAFADQAAATPPAAELLDAPAETGASVECGTATAEQDPLAAALLGQDPLAMSHCGLLTCEQCCNFDFQVCWDSCFINPPHFPCARNCEIAYWECLGYCGG